MRTQTLDTSHEMPDSIRRFEQLFLASLVLGVIQGALVLSDLKLDGTDAAYFAASIVVMLLLVACIVLLVSRRKSVIAKWALVVLLVLGLIGYIPSLSRMINQGVMGFISIIQFSMQVFATYLLFNEDSKKWFASKKANK